MGAMIKDNTTLDILVQLNRRFEAPDAISEMVALQKEFVVFSTKHHLRESFALLGIVPADWGERRRWYRFLELLKSYGSDLPGVNGHDRVIKAFVDDLESEHPIPVSIRCHSAANDPRVTVSRGQPVVFSLDEYVMVSIPTTPGREARRQASGAASRRRAERGKKKE
jgi:hypothetical protein